MQSLILYVVRMELVLFHQSQKTLGFDMNLLTLYYYFLLSPYGRLLLLSL